MSVVEIYKVGSKSVRLQDAFWISRISRYKNEKEMEETDFSEDKRRNQKHTAKLYIARTTINGELVFGKFYPSNNTVYIPYDQKGHFLLVSELLIARPKSLAWVSFVDDVSFENAVIGGHDEKGEPLLIGRTKIEKIWTPGKIVLGSKRSFVSWGNKEFDKYEILVATSSSLSLPQGAKWADVNLNETNEL